MQQSVLSQQVYFNNRYDFYNSWEVAWNIIQLDSNYLMVGGAGDSLTGNNTIGILFTDQQGNQVLEKSFNHPAGEEFSGTSSSLIQTVDGGFALGGSISTGGTSYAMLWRFNENMDTLWTKTYGDTSYDQIGYQCKQTPDKGFVIIGVTNVSGNDDILLIKTDSVGNLLWNTIYGGGKDELAFTIDVCYNGGYIIGGEVIDIPSDNIDDWVIKVDSVGNVEWDTIFGGAFEDLGTFVKQTQDGGYIVGCGYSLYENPPDFYQSKPRVIKLDSSGKVVWDKLYGQERFAAHVLIIDELQDGSFIAAGQSNNNKGTPNGNGWAIGFALKVSAQGDSIWYREYEYDTCDKNDDYLRDMKLTSDGGFIIAGFFGPRPATPCNDTGSQDMWVMKLDSCGCLFAGCDSACQQLVGIEDLQITDAELTLRIYPNPAGSIATVKVPNSAEGIRNYELHIYDITGRELKSYAMQNQPTLTINTEELGSGLYFLRLSALGRQEGRLLGSGKLVVE